MKLMDWVIFGGLALGAHVAFIVWTTAPQGGDSGSGGAQGADRITVTAASAQMTQIIETWTQPPEVMDQSPSQNLTPPQPEPVLNTQATQRVTNDPLISAAAPKLIETVLDEVAPVTPAPLMAAPVIRPDMAQIAVLPHRPADSSVSARDRQPVLSSDAPPPLRTAQPQIAAPSVTRPTLDTSTAQVNVNASDTPIPKTRPKPRPNTVLQIAQSAKGRGTNPVAGTSATPKSSATGHSSAKVKSDTATWAAQIHNAIERKKFYPKGTRARGRVMLQVTVAPDGRLLAASVTQSSGFGVLDRAALTAVQRARFPKAPESLQQPRYNFRIPIKLTAN